MSVASNARKFKSNNKSISKRSPKKAVADQKTVHKKLTKVVKPSKKENSTVIKSENSSKPQSIKVKNQKRKIVFSRNSRKHIVKRRYKLPSAFNIYKQSIEVVSSNKKFFFKVSLMFGLLNLIFVRGFSSSFDIPAAKEILQSTFTGSSSSAAATVTIFGSLLTSSGVSSSAAQNAGLFQWMITILISLSTLFGLRRIFAKEDVSVKDSLYNGLYPIVPFLLVCLIVSMQLIPLAVGSWMYSVLIIGGLAVSNLERIISFLLIALLALSTLRMLSSSIFALYIVALPRMTPFRALRSARDLVQKRRINIARKIFFLPLILFIAAALIMLPFIVFLPNIAEWIYFLFTIVSWLFILIYMYVLYRELLNE